MDSYDIESYFRQHRKTLAVVFLMVCMLAVSGFFMGMRQTEHQAIRNQTPTTDQPTLSAAEIPTAPKYREISNTEWHANRDCRRPPNRTSYSLASGKRRCDRTAEIPACLRWRPSRDSPCHRYPQVIGLHILSR